MANYDDELLAASRHLFTRRNGQRGRLPSARIRRSISTSYYALFHFMLDEIGRRIVGTQNGLRVRRRVVARTIGHASIKRTLDKARGGTFDLGILPFISSDVNAVPLAVPRFVRNLALAFIDAHAKREDADYNLNEELSAADARLLYLRVRRAIRGWREAKAASDKDMKKAICLLIVLKGQLRTE